MKWNAAFFDKDRICLNFDPLDQSLCDDTHGRIYRGLTMTEFRLLIHQIANTLSHQNWMKIVHGDVKLDNILVVKQQS